MLVEAGGDAICNGSIFLRNQTPACHLKADGKVYKAPNYRAWAVSWDTPGGLRREGRSKWGRELHGVRPSHHQREEDQSRHLRSGHEVPRSPTAIGTKGGRFAYYVSRERHTPEQLRDLLAASGWDNAIMMDGGGSACFMDAAGEGFAGDGRVIPFFLVWKLKNEQTDEPEGEKPMVEINAYSKAKDGGKRLSANFTVKEFACKDGSDAVLTAPRLVMVLQSIRSHFAAPVVIHSAYRTPQYNAKVGGAAHSQHCYGTAADISRAWPDPGSGGGLRKRSHARLGRRGRVRRTGLHPHRRAGDPGRLERLRCFTIVPHRPNSLSVSYARREYQVYVLVTPSLAFSLRDGAF